MAFKVGDIITDDHDYYREDDATVRNVWSSRKPFAFLWGLRRSGKTSFLRKVARFTPPGQRTFLFDFYDPAVDLNATLASLLKYHDDALVLVDEIFRCVTINDRRPQDGDVLREIFVSIVEAVVGSSGRLRCLIADAPSLRDELLRRPDDFPFVEDSDYHTLSGLNFAEVRNLLRQSKAPEPVADPVSDMQLMEWAGVVSGLAQEVNALGKFLQENPGARPSGVNSLKPSSRPTWQETWARAASDANYVPWAKVVADMPPNLRLLLSICGSEDERVPMADLNGAGKHAASVLQDYGLLELLDLPGGGQQHSIRSIALRKFLAELGSEAVKPLKDLSENELKRVLRPEAVERLLPAAETPSSWTIHHLSDLHIGRYLGELSERSSHGLDYRRSRLESYLQTLDALNPGQRPHLIIISGDLTSTGDNKEFTECVKFLTALRARSRLQPIRPATGSEARQVVVVPGNHDQQWADVDANVMTRDLFELFGNRFEDHPNPFRARPTSRGLAPAECFPEANLLVYTLNTSMAPLNTDVGADRYHKLLEQKYAIGNDPSARWTRSSKLDMEHTTLMSIGEELEEFVKHDVGCIAEGDISALVLNEGINEACNRAKALRSGKSVDPSRMLKIAVCHYNPYQLDDDPIVDLLGAAKLREALVTAGFPIVLHGHKHKASIVREIDAFGKKRALVTIGAASLGATPIGSPGKGENWGFNEIVVTQDPHPDASPGYDVKLVNWVFDADRDRFVPSGGSETSFKV